MAGTASSVASMVSTRKRETKVFFMLDVLLDEIDLKLL